MKSPPRLWRLAIDHLVEFNDTEQLSRIAVPTLLLWGDKDPLFTPTEQDQVIASLSAGQLKIYENTGHCPNWERPDKVAADLANFVKDH